MIEQHIAERLDQILTEYRGRLARCVVDHSSTEDTSTDSDRHQNDDEITALRRTREN